jgi:hypothetical protein
MEGAMKRSVIQGLVVVILVVGAAVPGASQTSSELQAYFTRIGLSQEDITGIHNGQPVAKNLESRSPAEIFVFGAVYINAPPESYVKFASDFDRMRKVPGFLAIEKFSTPPQLSDLKGFGLGSEDVKALKDCKLADCKIQLPGSVMEQLHQSVNWSAADVDQQVNQFLQKLALQRLLTYQKEGNRILGAVYNDKNKPTTVVEQFKYILSYDKAFPKALPDLHNYLLSYPESKPANAEDTFYWDNVKFGLKPTLRVVHVVTRRGSAPQEPAYAIVEKQLYASHYFETALDLTFCIRGEDPKQSGFYLVKLMGSEQAGLTGFKGSIVRKMAVSKSVSGLKNSLAAIKNALEHH